MDWVGWSWVGWSWVSWSWVGWSWVGSCWVGWSGVGDWSDGELSGGGGKDLCNGWNVAEGVFAHDSVEAIVGVGGVVDGSFGAIGVDQTVLSLDNVTIAYLVLAFGVAGDGVLHFVGKLVGWVGVVFFGSQQLSGSSGVDGARHWIASGQETGLGEAD